MADKKHRINLRKFFLTIILPTLLSISLFIILIFWYIIPYFESNLLQSKKEMIRELVQSTISIANKNYSDFKKGIISEDSAKFDAISKISSLRYGIEGKDYFFITDMHPKMIAHPYRPDLIGTDLTQFKDPNGKQLFRDMVLEVKKNGSGYVDYQWQWMDDSDHIVPKISYVSEFKPWGWVIGTGIYIEDVKEKISEIEREMLIVAISISIIIAILLTIIVFQNFKTEIKRSNAEKELSISEEKYRSLVEASTEGTAMILDGELIYTNKIFDKMFPNLLQSGISDELSEIINPLDINSYHKIIDFLNSELNYIQTEVQILGSGESPNNVLLSLSKISLSGKSGLILILKELSTEISFETEKSKWSKHFANFLQETRQSIFILSLDEEGKFLEFNDHTLSLLNYTSKSDLQSETLISLAENKADAILFLNSLKSHEFILDYKISVRKSSGELISILIDAKIENIPSENKSFIIGIFRDITQKEELEATRESTISEIQSSLMHYNKELQFFQRETVSCNMNLSAQKAALLMSRNDTDALIIRSSDGEPIGIVTDSDIRARLIGEDQIQDTPVYSIMSSPLFSLKETDTLAEAFVKMEENGIHHIVVRNSENEISGIIGIDEILKNQYSTSHILIASINSSNTLAELKDIYKRLPFFVKSAVSGGVKSEFIISSISQVAHEITRRISELIYLEIGEPPVDFSFVTLGSEGRREQTLVTDQDNAIIYEDVDDSRNSEVEFYFARFAERMNYMLDAIGYDYCKGGIMAKNPKWNKPLKVWKQYFKEWIINPEPQHLLEIAIFFDMKHSIGSSKILDELFKYVNSILKENPGFFNFMARVGMTYKTQLSFFGKIQTEAIEEHSKTVNVKNAIRVIVNLVRLYAMKNGLSETNTIRRLKQLYELNVFSGQFYKDIVFSYEFLTILQLKTQVNSILQQSNPANYIDLSSLSSIEINLLKNVFSQVSIFQSKLKFDFGIND